MQRRVGGAVLAGAVGRPPPGAMSGPPLSPPSAAHPFGTDDLGRDMLTEILYAGQTSLRIGFVVAFLSTILGTVVGAVVDYVVPRAGRLVALAVVSGSAITAGTVLSISAAFDTSH